MLTLHRNRTRQPHLPTFLESLNLLIISVAILAANNATPTQDQKKSFKSNITEFWDSLSLCRCNPAHQPDLKPSTIKPKMSQPIILKQCRSIWVIFFPDQSTSEAEELQTIEKHRQKQGHTFR